MILRRFLLLALVAYCASLAAQQSPEKPYKVRPLLYDVQEVHPTGNCPPDDVGGWKLDGRVTPSTKIYWAVVTDDDMRRYCPGDWACAESRGEVGFIYALMPASMYPNWLLLHEFCHTQGWVHGEWPQWTAWHLFRN